MSDALDKKTASENRFSLLRVILGVMIVLLVLLMFLPPPTMPRSQALRVACNAHLQYLSRGLFLYAEQHGHAFPTPERWCDVLVQGFGADMQKFMQCPGAKGGPCHYAMNPLAEPNSPPDTVLLFESGSGWNQFGGPELLTTEHHKGLGCNVLFVSWAVRWIEASELGKLKWKALDDNAGKEATVQELELGR